MDTDRTYPAPAPDTFDTWAFLALTRPLESLSRALYNARWPAGYRPRSRAADRVTRDRNAIARAARAYRRQLQTVRDYLMRTWPEYGRKLDEQWWAGHEHVSVCRDPIIAGAIGAGSPYGEGVSTRDGGSFSRSGIHTRRALFQDVPVGAWVIDAHGAYLSAAPMFNVASAAGVPSWGVDGACIDRGPVTLADVLELAASDATTPGGMAYVGLRWYLAAVLRLGASIGQRTDVGAVTWHAGPAAGTVETFEPAPFYPAECQPPYPPAL